MPSFRRGWVWLRQRANNFVSRRTLGKRAWMGTFPILMNPATSSGNFGSWARRNWVLHLQTGLLVSARYLENENRCRWRRRDETLWPEWRIRVTLGSATLRNLRRHNIQHINIDKAIYWVRVRILCRKQKLLKKMTKDTIEVQLKERSFYYDTDIYSIMPENQPCGRLQWPKKEED